TDEQLLTTDMDLVVAGTDEAVLMVECGANEVPEAEILDALDIAHSAIKKLCAAQVELQKKAGKPKQEIEVKKAPDALIAKIAKSHGKALDKATSIEDKLARQDATQQLEAEVLAQYSGDVESEAYEEYRQNAQLAFDALEKRIIRERIAQHKRRPDGRSEREIRPITVDVKPLPRTHGSALFT